jgi:hypothetical protein
MRKKEKAHLVNEDPATEDFKPNVPIKAETSEAGRCYEDDTR